ncbi:MAG TPA: hypothetical protein VFH66_00555 [Mycobacteriales bacterium]|nr:hypothetical protein [Mycobacteriales bacterium]
MTAVPGEPIVLHQSVGNALQLPILIGVVTLAVAVSEIARGPSVLVLVVCAVAAVLDGVLVGYLMRNFRATLTVTGETITFTRHQARGTAPEQVIRRVAETRLTFRSARNGPLGSEYTGYTLKLRDTATGEEIFAGAFGRRWVQQACASQGWPFG